MKAGEADSIEFEIPGTPVPKGRPRFSTFGKYPKAYEPHKTAVYENWVAVCYMEACPGEKPLEGAVIVEITAYFPLNKGDYNSKGEPNRRGMAKLSNGEPHTKKPDLDNLIKSILDGLGKANAWRDDSQVVAINARKAYSEEGRAIVRIIHEVR